MKEMFNRNNHSIFLVFLLFFCLFPLSLIESQYGYGENNFPDSYYINMINSNDTMATDYDTVMNATDSDEDLTVFTETIYSPTTVYLLEGSFSVGPSFNGLTYTRMDMSGIGSFWQQISGIGALYIDLRPGAYTQDQLASAGATYNANGTISFNINYVNSHNGVDSIHAHGILGNWWYDGIAYLTNNPINSGMSEVYTYTINPTVNSGSYFIHSHYDFNSAKGMSAPLIIQTQVDSNYMLASELNNPNITDVILFLEDFCLVYTNADDAETSGDNYTDYHVIHDRYICENPQLAYRAVFGEWNSDKGPRFLGYGQNGVTAGGTSYPPRGEGDLNTCSAPTDAPEFGFSYFLANDRTFDNPQLIAITPGSTVRLRLINAARMTNYLIQIPTELQAKVIATDGHYINPVELSAVNNNNSIWVGIAQRIDLFVIIPNTPGVYPIIAYEEAPATGESNSPAFAPFEISYTAGIILYSTNTEPANNLIPQSIPGVGMLSQHPEYLINQEKLFTPYVTEIGTGNDLSWTNAWKANVNNMNHLDLTGYNGIYGLNFQPYLQFPPLIPLTTPTLIQPYNLVNQQAIHVKYNDKVCITMTNWNWDTHPMHLHGHSFRIVDINGTTISGPVRDTAMVIAGNCYNVTICFNANNIGGGVHGFHCHMIVHEMAGMFTTVQYDNYAAITTEIPTTSTASQTIVVNNDSSSNNPGAIAAAVIFALLFGFTVVGGYFYIKQLKRKGGASQVYGSV